jgi:hypothetical protein
LPLKEQRYAHFPGAHYLALCFVLGHVGAIPLSCYTCVFVLLFRLSTDISHLFSASKLWYGSNHFSVLVVSACIWVLYNIDGKKISPLKKPCFMKMACFIISMSERCMWYQIAMRKGRIVGALCWSMPHY